MDIKDWIVMAYTFLACFGGSAFGAYLTNRHDRKVREDDALAKQKQKEVDDLERRRKNLHAVLGALSGLLTHDTFYGINTEIKSFVSLGDVTGKDPHLAKEFIEKWRKIDYEIDSNIYNADNPLCTDRLSSQFLQFSSFVNMFCFRLKQLFEKQDFDDRGADKIIADFEEDGKIILGMYFNLHDCVIR